MAKELSDFNKKLKVAMKSQGRTPSITVNKLGEFLIASPKRQRRILEQLKYPAQNKFGATAHSEAREAIKQYFISEFESDAITECIEELRAKTGGTEHSIKMDNSSIKLLEGILESESIEFESFAYEAYTGDNPKLMIKGVEVSVYPDLLIKSSSRGKEYVGGIKFHLSSSSPLPEEAGKYIAAIIHHFVSETVIEDGELTRPDHNISFDVPTDSFVQCPPSVKRRWEDIEAGCMNIAAIWDSI